MLLEELIERAFCEGYEYAQKEFGAVKRENKKKKREWLEKLGKEKSDSYLHHILDEDELETVKNKLIKNAKGKNTISDNDVYVNIGRVGSIKRKPTHGDGIHGIIHNNALRKSGKYKSFDFDDYNDDLKYKYGIGKYKKNTTTRTVKDLGKLKKSWFSSRRYCCYRRYCIWNKETI
jgi:hypothetical protein